VVNFACTIGEINTEIIHHPPDSPGMCRSIFML